MCLSVYNAVSLYAEDVDSCEHTFLVERLILFVVCTLTTRAEYTTPAPARPGRRGLVISTPSVAAAAAVPVGLELPGPAGRSSIGRTDEG